MIGLWRLSLAAAWSRSLWRRELLPASLDPGL